MIKSIYKISIGALLLFTVQVFGQLKPEDDFTYIQIDSTKQMWGDWAEPEWLRYFGLDAGDVDRDGNMDILSGRYVYHNPGGAMEGNWRRTVLDDNVDGILMMDVDGDPYADIVAMALPNLYWYEATNLEGTRYQRTKIGEVPATSHVNSQGFEKAQLIPGGPKEFVIAGDGDIYAVQALKNEKGGIDWNVKMICENTSDEGIGVGDIDGDGDLDIAAGRRPEGEGEPKILVWYENPGNIDVLWKPTVVGESVHPIDRVEVADLNGDGKADIVITEERYPGLEPDANFWWFAQESTAKWTRNKIVTQFSINNLDITDIDKDGDIDLLTAEHKGTALELQLWKNDGAGVFSKSILDTGKENHLGTQWVDLDADGDLDIIGSGWDRHQYMHVWRNDAIRSLKTGMIFREYPWTPEQAKDEGKFLRVGGKLDYTINEDHFPQDLHRDGFITLDADVDLSKVIGAEVIVERVQSHEDTKNLTIQFNGGKPIPLPEPVLISKPATDYMFHSNIRVPVAIADLKAGNQNTFKLKVNKDQAWGWPQNLIYGVVLRLYYASDRATAYGVQKSARMKRVFDGTNQKEVLSEVIYNMIDAPDIASVEYIGLFEDVNLQGDGKYRQWQFRHHRGKREGQLGIRYEAPFEMRLNPDILPDQLDPVRIIALATDTNGLTRVIPVDNGLKIKRNHSVTLLKPWKQPPFWTTRNGEHEQYFNSPVSGSEVKEASLFWNSWSPCYSEGIELNGTVQAADKKVPCYDAHWHDWLLAEIGGIKKGKNVLKTLKTPLHDGEMVHGMEVQWPGIMLKVKHSGSGRGAVEISEGEYEGRPHYIVYTKAATYYLDRAGGGFSRMIDTYGNDWIAYRTEPWDQYPASAASSFRGVPNLVFGSETDGGAGHPGHDKCTSVVSGDTVITTTTKSGKWKWEWRFYDNYVELNVLETDQSTPYWFLYEGTPGGSYRPEKSYFGTDSTGFQDNVPDFFKGTVAWGNYQWAYFSRSGVATSFYVSQKKTDTHTDMMSYLGNTEEGALSKNGMTVFGFGRGKNTKPLLTGPNSFVLGWTDYGVENQETHDKIAKQINSIIKPLN